MTSISGWSQADLAKIRLDYRNASAELEKHIKNDQWIDDDPRSPALLERQWKLAGDWVVAWLEARPSASLDDVKAALVDLTPSEKCDVILLDTTTFLIVSPGHIGNVFIVTKSRDHWRVAWSTAQRQNATGKQALILSAWRAENARLGGRGPYWAASGSAGPVIPRIGVLPADSAAHGRFYIDGIYAQGAGGTVGAQISIWLWDGVTAQPLIARDYSELIDQQVGTRLDGDLLKVQEKKSFRSFFSCGMCEERQTDWIVRITGNGIEEVGEKVVVPELDAVDELIYRLIHGKPADDIAAPSAITAAKLLVREARETASAKDWKRFPTLGMMSWKLTRDGDEEVVCLATDDASPSLFRIRPTRAGFFIVDVQEAKDGCGRE